MQGERLNKRYNLPKKSLQASLKLLDSLNSTGFITALVLSQLPTLLLIPSL